MSLPMQISLFNSHKVLERFFVIVLTTGLFPAFDMLMNAENFQGWGERGFRFI